MQLDDAHIGGERSAEKVGRGSGNKDPFVAAVSLNAKGQRKHLRLDLVGGFSAEAVAKLVKASSLPNTTMFSDGLACFVAVTDVGSVRAPRIVGALKPLDLPEFKWVNTVPGNLKTTLTGTFKARRFRKYAQSWLADFASRSNHRCDLSDLIVDVARTKPMPAGAVMLRHASLNSIQSEGLKFVIIRLHPAATIY